MRIASVSATEMSSPIEPPQERRFLGGVRRLLKRDVVVVRVETADGAVGHAPAGATSSAMREYFEGATHDSFAELVAGPVADAVRGANPSDPATATNRIRELDLPELLESQAVAALDVACHDLWGRSIGAPVFELLAADADEPRRELPLYASAGMYMEPEGYADQAAALQDRGFGGYKYRPGLGPERDLETLRLLRERVGPEMDLMVDAHTWWKLGERSYGFEQVADLVAAMAEYDPYWVEEPVPPGDHDAYRRLAARVDVPLAGGESEASPAGLRRLAETGVAFLQGDVRHHDGFTGCRAAVAACRDRGVRFVPHNFGTHLGLVANAHLAAAAGCAVLEYPVFGDDVAAMYPFPLAEDVLVESLDVSNGTFAVPDGPGLGVTVDEAAFERYPYVEGPWTEFAYEAGDGA